MTKKNLHFRTIPTELAIKLPASKSISNRALILNALSYSPYNIKNLSDCDDTQVMIQALDSNHTHFDVGAAGTAMRFLTAFLAKTVGEWHLTGSHRMQERPIKILVDTLNSLGARIEYTGKPGYPPLRIYGSALKGGEIHLDGGISSQYISALMMIAPYMQDGLTLHLEGDIISVPYIEMTRHMMDTFGVQVEFTDNIIRIHPQTYRPVAFEVESDWSAASYWYELLSIAGKGMIKLTGLRQDSYQGDSRVADIFRTLGVHTRYQPDGVELTPGETTVRSYTYNFINQPDLAQTIAVSCCMKDIPFHFTGLQSLKIKETDRIAALIAELRKLGYTLHEPASGELAWEGKKDNTAETNPVIDTYEDHRMAMAFAPAALKQAITIAHPEVVSKSYPTFWDDLDKLDS